MKIQLVFLTLNEITGLREIFPKIPDQYLAGAFAIDGGSTDGTLEFFKDHNIAVVGQSKRGRGEAMRLAFNHTQADALLFFSPDGNENPLDIPQFLLFLEEGNDLVIASRMMKGARNEEDREFFKPRKWANNLFNGAVNILWNRGRYITDSINGFRAIRKEAFEKMHLDEPGFTIEYQMTIRALKMALKIKEFPTMEGSRIGGETGAKAIPTGLRFLRLLLKEVLAFRKIPASIQAKDPKGSQDPR